MSDLLNIGQLLAAQARLQPGRVGGRDLSRTLTYKEWNRRSCCLANALFGLGLKRGDRIAVLAFNRLEWAEILVAAAKAGLIVVPINFRLSPSEVDFIILNSGAQAVIVEAPLTGVIETIRDGLSLSLDRFILVDGSKGQSGWSDYEALLLNGRDTEPEISVTPDDAWCIMYTSGTTGRPKGAIRTHRDIAALSLMTAVELTIQRKDDALLVMPMCHANSLFFFSSFVYAGAAITIFSRQSFDPELCLRTMGNIGTSFTSLVPTQYIMMLDVPKKRLNGAKFDRVEKLMVSSAPARVDTKQAVMEMFPNTGLYELYGSTEGGWVTMLHPDEQFDHLGTVGRETIGSAPIRLLDDDGIEVADGKPGELFSCSPYNFAGYWNNPEKTKAAFRGDYMSVGDIAIRDEHGFIKLIDRKNNVIITGGENVYPSEVEAVVGSHHAVADVAVVGLPDSKWGEQVTAAVVSYDGQNLSEQEVIDWCRDKLAGFKCPRQVIFIQPGEMPRNPTGKIQHRLLRETLSHQGNVQGSQR